MDNLPQTKKPRLVADFSLDHTGGWRGGGGYQAKLLLKISWL